jgi:hypothetical protein
VALKVCSTCGEAKDETQFAYRNKALGRRWGTCKSCQSEQRRKWYRKNRAAHIKTASRNKKKARAEAQQYIWDYLTAHPCVDCGESNPVVLEFDHVRGKKRMAVANMARQGYSIGAIEEEIAKCVVRCANCHRIKTHKERGWFRG